jgi:formiminoglutamase
MKESLSLVSQALPVEYCSRQETLGSAVTSLHQLMESRFLESSSKALAGKIILLGVPDDRGVKCNGGNAGADLGPEAFRSAFYKLYDGEIRSAQPTVPQMLSDCFVDAGNLILQESIEKTHEHLAVVVRDLLLNGAALVVTVGGGHDFSFGTYKGHAEAFSGIVPIVNIDAHFDLRPLSDGQINSGTPFYRIIENLPKSIAQGAALLELGIQPERNAPSLYRYAKEHGVQIIEYLWMEGGWRECETGRVVGPQEHVYEFIDRCVHLGWERYKGPLHLSLDLDVFSAWIAPGTSASTPIGVTLEELSSVFSFFARSQNCRVLDLAELCPPRDQNSQTARLAASLVYQFGRTRLEFASR